MNIKLQIFKGCKTEAKFDNGMSLELWYDRKKNYEDAKTVMADLVKCWNMHDEIIEGLKEIAEGKGRYDTDKLKHASNTIEDMITIAKELIKRTHQKS